MEDSAMDSALDSAIHSGMDSEMDSEMSSPHPEPTQRRAPTPQVLFTMRRVRKRAIWQFVKLAAKHSRLHVARRELKNADADCAWCLRCKESIPFGIGNHGVHDHMKKRHARDLASFPAHRGDPCRSLDAIFQSYSGPHAIQDDAVHRNANNQPITLRDLTEAEQKRANELLALWVAKKFRPICVVEDEGFIDYVQYLCRDVAGLNVAIPKRTEVRESIKTIACNGRKALLLQIKSKCLFYSITTDIWTDRGGRSFISVTLHYVDEEFGMHANTLEVQHCPGKHNATAIASTLEDILQRWLLKKRYCSKLLRDGASNAVAAGRLLQVDHMSCLAHCLHLVLVALLMKKIVTDDVNLDDDEDTMEALEAQVAGVALDDDDDDDALGLEALQREAVEEAEVLIARVPARVRNPMDRVRTIVQRFRTLAAFFKRSPKARARLLALQVQPENGGDPVGVIIDCPTRWNSTYDMLKRFVKLEDIFGLFFAFLHSDPGKAEFNKLKLRRPEPDEWFTIKCLLRLLAPFAAATKRLQGEQYPTLPMALPCLRGIKKQLLNDQIFAWEAGVVGQRPFVGGTIKLMQQVRNGLVGLFQERFTGLDLEFLWVTYLDPRSVKMTHLREEEHQPAKQCLFEAAVQIQRETNATTAEAVQVVPTAVNAPLVHQDADAELEEFMYGPRAVVENASVSVEVGCKDEIARYLVNASSLVDDPKIVVKEIDPLQWWHKHGHEYPALAKLARKWLGCVVTTVPSERAFSTGGNTVTIKRCSLSPDLVRDIVFIAGN